METLLQSSSARHRTYVLTPWSAQAALDPPVIVRGAGAAVYDAAETRYLDLSAGLVCVNLGHGHPAVLAAIAAQAERLCYAPPHVFNDARAALAQALIELAPWAEGGRVFFTPGGAQANEDALKIARFVSGRPKALAAYRSFHGSSPGAGTLTGENRRWPVEPGIPGVVHFFSPFPYRGVFAPDPAEEGRRALEHVAQVVAYENPEAIAALIVEPVVGTNGVIVYPEGYLAGLRALCDRHGILLIFDEVMTGFGRTGAAFAGERFGVVPDLITFAKGVTSGYVPLGGVMVRERLARYFDDHVLGCGHTYSGHPLATAAGLGALHGYREDGLFARARALEPRLRSALEGLRDRHRAVGDVRGIGAFFALELVREDGAPLVPWQGQAPADNPLPAFFAELRRRGVLLFARYNVVIVAPPLVITDAEIDAACEALDGALALLD